MRARPLSAIGRIADSNRTSPQARKLLNGDMRELQHLILHGLVSAFVRAMPYTLLGPALETTEKLRPNCPAVPERSRCPLRVKSRHWDYSGRNGSVAPPSICNSKNKREGCFHGKLAGSRS